MVLRWLKWVYSCQAARTCFMAETMEALDTGGFMLASIAFDSSTIEFEAASEGGVCISRFTRPFYTAEHVGMGVVEQDCGQKYFLPVYKAAFRGFVC